MAITFISISIEDVKAVFGTLVVPHWHEVVRDPNFMPLEPDWAGYAQLERMQMLHSIGAYDGDRLVGYVLLLVFNHMHYMSCKVAVDDAYYLHPDYRKGTVGLRLFRAAEKLAKNVGAVRICLRAKPQTPAQRLLKALPDYAELETVYTKRLV
jgi:GNAT superfamily N-acetyltransferase